MPIRSLYIAERVALWRAHANAIHLCRRVFSSSDMTLCLPVEMLMSARPTPARLEGIRNDYRRICQKIQSLDPGSDAAFRRDTGENCYAYVYPHNDQTIYLCNLFFWAPRQGIDSCAGALIHEVSHFMSVLGTGDYAYGANTLSLPFSQARRNADGYEYIAEHFMTS